MLKFCGIFSFLTDFAVVEWPYHAELKAAITSVHAVHADEATNNVLTRAVAASIQVIDT